MITTSRLILCRESSTKNDSQIILNNLKSTIQYGYHISQVGRFVKNLEKTNKLLSYLWVYNIEQVSLKRSKKQKKKKSATRKYIFNNHDVQACVQWIRPIRRKDCERNKKKNSIMHMINRIVVVARNVVIRVRISMVFALYFKTLPTNFTRNKELNVKLI